MLLSPLCAAISSVIVKKHLTKEDPYVLNVIQMGLGILLLFPLAFVIEDLSSFKWNATSIGAVVFLGSFGSAFAFVTLYSLMKKMAASRLSLIAFVTPVVAALLGWLALDETPTWATVAGAALVLLGIYIVNILAERDKTIAIEAAAVEAIDCGET
jgi:drug/metabolite transporter (DMT)-like permease